LPEVQNDVEMAAVPALNVCVPSAVEPLEKATVPVADEGETLAERLTLAPSAGERDEGVRVVVDAVSPVTVMLKAFDVLDA
jgi:hypothetical protein